MLRVSRLLRLLPLLVKRSPSPVRGRFQHNLSPRNHRRPQRSERVRSLPSPPRNLRAVQVLYRPSPPRILVRRRHRELAIQMRKHQFPRTRMRSLQRTLLQLRRQVIPEAMHDSEDLLRRQLVVRHQHRQRPLPRDRLHKKTRRQVRRHPNLPRLQHYVFLRARLQAHPRIFPLHRVHLDRRRLPHFRPDLKMLLNPVIPLRPLPEFAASDFSPATLCNPAARQS